MGDRSTSCSAVAAGSVAILLSGEQIGHSRLSTEPSPELFSTQQRSCFDVGRLSCELLRQGEAAAPREAAAAPRRAERPAERAARAFRVPLWAPTRLQMSLERHRWHGVVVGGSAPRCTLVEVTAPHVALSLSPAHTAAIYKVYCAIYNCVPASPTPSKPPATTPTPTRNQSAESAELPAAAAPSSSQSAAISSNQQHSAPSLSPSPSAAADSAAAASPSVSTDDLQAGAPFRVASRAGGRAGAWTITHAPAAAEETWVSWRYPLPRVVLVAVLRDHAANEAPRRRASAAGAASGGGGGGGGGGTFVCELSRWDMTLERFEVVMRGRMHAIGDACELLSAGAAQVLTPNCF